ncbi:MAG TPA: adenylyltransferase/cytidyltransferase family protein, partial [Anaerolineales bacterium]|nr:adenylyltransferase/cytidyltransferase family protein [Anaerolineales bacterium]
MITKTVFVVMNAEFIHPGHINIILVARELGEVTVGLATDRLNARTKRVAVLSYEQRKKIVENIVGVKRVIPQDTLDLGPVLRELRPDYFVHGDDWKYGRLSPVRAQVIQLLGEWGGELVEPAYTPGVSSTMLNDRWLSANLTPELRRDRLSELMEHKEFIRFQSVSNDMQGIREGGASASNKSPSEFDVLWFTKLGDAREQVAAAESVPEIDSAILAINHVLDTRTEPMVVECPHEWGHTDFPYVIRTLERLGVSAVCLGGVPTGADEEPGWVSNRSLDLISTVRMVQMTDGFKTFVRLPTPGNELWEEDWLNHALACVEAGADGLVTFSAPERLSPALA